MNPFQGLAGIAGATIVAALGYAYRRFRRSRVNEIESFSRYLTQGVKYYLGRYVRRQLAAELMLRQYSRIQLQGTASEMLVPARYPVRLEVDNVFVPLLLRAPTGETFEYREVAEGQRNRVVIIGDPGSGKSSLLKRAFRDACRQANTDPRHSPLPVLFSLSDLADLSEDDQASLDDETLFRECTSQVTESAVFNAKAAVNHLRHGAGYLVLLDGLDELPTAITHTVVDAISDLSDRLAVTSPRSSIIVTTRTQHYVSVLDRTFKRDFDVLSIRPFVTADIYRFLSRWPFAADARAHITRLFSRIRLLPSLGEMCTNPLALAMFVAQDQQTEATLSPETRSEFYDTLLDELIVNRRFRTDAARVGRQRLRAERSQILGEACLDHLLDATEARNSVPASRLLDAVNRGAGGVDAAQYLTNIAVDTGLLAEERRGETYRFLHLSLCEFLAAREVVNQGAAGWDKVYARLARGDRGAATQTMSASDRELSRASEGGEWSSRLGEVVAFSAGLAPRALRARILDDLIRLGDTELLLRATIETQSYGDDEVLQAIRHKAEQLANVEADAWDIAWYASLRLVIEVLRDIRQVAMPRQPGETEDLLPTPSEYLTELIDLHDAGNKILGTLARQDPGAAVTVAETSGRGGFLDAVAEAADDASVAVAIVARCEAGDHQWKRALVAAALRRGTIAEALSNMSDESGPKPAGPGWSTSILTRRTVYGRLLDEVLVAPPVPDDVATIEMDAAMRTLSYIRPPQRRLPSIVGAWARAATSLLAIAALIGLPLLLALHSYPSQLAVVIPLAVFPSLVLISAVRNRSPRLLVQWAIELRLVEDRSRDNPAQASWMPAIPSRLSRKPVLEEVINLKRYRFRGEQRRAENDWTPSRVRRAFARVRREDIRALVVLRRLRRDHSRELISGAG